MIKIKTKKNTDIILFNGYSYTTNGKLKNGFSRWRCTNRSCCGRLFFNEFNELHQEKMHKITCVPNEVKNQQREKLYKIKVDGAKTNLRPVEIVADNIGELNNNELIGLPKLKNIKDSITKNRPKIHVKEKLPYFDLIDNLKKTKQGLPFFRHDSGYEDSERLVIFYTDFLQNCLNLSQIWVLDGTFKSCPHDFYQLFIIHSFVFNKTIPVVYALLKSKKQSVYEKLFKYLADNGFLPKTIVCDFELSIYKAIKLVFCNVKIYFCRFHFGQNLWRSIQKYNLSNIYKKDPTINTLIKNIFHLIFFPTKHVYEAFEYIKGKILSLQNNNLNNFLFYFEKTYIGKKFDNNLKKNTSLYLIDEWNCYDRIINDLPRTTNGAESFHRTLNKYVRVPHPNIGKLIETLLMIEDINRLEFIQLLEGNYKLNLFNLKFDFKLKMILKHFNFYDIETYLYLLSKNIYWKED